jgi:tetratricopeptide (TPR) repeat protein
MKIVWPLESTATIRRYFVLITLLLITLTAPLISFAQTSAPPLLPPEAQELVKKGILAAKQQDYLLATRFFQDARKMAPQAPEIYYDLGLAESKIPGREVRAIAWFGAYLAANPNAQNAAAVKDQIDVLDVKSQGNMSRLIQSVQDTASKIAASHISNDLYETTNGNIFSHGSDDHANFQVVAKLWAMAGDSTAAIKVADLIPAGGGHDPALDDIAEALADAADIAGAQKVTDRIKDIQIKADAQRCIVKAQAELGDIASAQNTADLIQDPIASAYARQYITAAQTSLVDAQKPAQASAQLVVSHWLSELDDGNQTDDCALNSDPFLDLPTYLNTLPQSDNPQVYFDALARVGYRLARAHSVIKRMLKERAGK